MDDNRIWVLEHSQHSEDAGMFPFTVTTLDDALSKNREDFWHNNRGANKWQILTSGSAEHCYEQMEKLLKLPRFNYYFIKADYKLRMVIRPGEKIPEIEGVYFLFDGNDLIYIGQSKNIGRRLISNHPVYDKSLLVGIWKTSEDDERLDTERWLIETYTPPMNTRFLEDVRNGRL